MSHRVLSRNPTPIAATLFLFIPLLHLTAAISQGPLITNATAAEERRLADFYRAEQSYQEKLKVGQERYDQRQAERAKVIAGMKDQLQARQQEVVIQPLPPSDLVSEKPAEFSRPGLVLIVIVFLFAGILYYWNRLRVEEQQRQLAQEAFLRQHTTPRSRR